MATHSTLAIGAAKTSCKVGRTRPAMLASNWPMKAPRQTVPTTSQRYAGQAATRARGGCSARSGVSAGTTLTLCDHSAFSPAGTTPETDDPVWVRCGGLQTFPGDERALDPVQQNGA